MRKTRRRGCFQKDLGRKVRITAENEEDFLSRLPDHLIHQILSFIKIKEAVQTSILSRRWNRVWATLPYLKFEPFHFGRLSGFCKFVNKFLSKRNQLSDISAIELNFYTSYNLRPKYFHELLKRVTNYAISHNVKQFSIRGGIIGEKKFPTSIFSSASSLQKLIWDTGDFIWDDSPILWNLPDLTDLHLRYCKSSPPLPPFMPSLTTLILDSVAFHRENSLSFEGLIHLKNLILRGLQMWHVMEVFSITSLSLKNLTISEYSWETPLTCNFVVSAPNLSCFECIGCSPISLSARDGLPCLEKVNIDIHISNYDWKRYSVEGQQVIFQQLISMFQEIHGAKFLSISFDTIKVLSTVSDFSEYQPSPFAYLNFLKLYNRRVQYDNQTDSPDEVINYLLSSSQGATILIQDVDGIIRDYNPKVNMLHSLNRTRSGDSVVDLEDISRDDEDVFLGRESHVSVEVDNLGEVNKQKKVHTDEERANKVQERRINADNDDETTVQDIMEEREEGNLGRMDFAMEADSDQQEPMIEVNKMIPGQVNYFTNVHVNGAAMHKDPGVVPPKTVPGGVNDQVCSYSVNNNFSLWEGHKVYSEYVDLLQHIMEKYPETFEHFAPQTEMIYTLGLNTLCASVIAYSQVSTTNVTPPIIIHYRGLFADLESWGFNTTWLVSCLKNADELCSIDHRLDDAQREVLELQVRLDDARKEVQELQAMRIAKMSEIQEAIGHFGTKLAATCH